jgi:hypothetical protein
MYSEQLAVLLMIAATQIANQGVSTKPMAQLPRDPIEQIEASFQLDPRQIRAANLTAKRAARAGKARAIKREVLLAEAP